MNKVLDWILSIFILGGIAVGTILTYIGIVLLILLPWIIKVGVVALLFYFGLGWLGII